MNGSKQKITRKHDWDDCKWEDGRNWKPTKQKRNRRPDKAELAIRKLEKDAA